MSSPAPSAAGKTAGALSPRRGRALVREIAQRHFGEAPRRVEQRGGGLSNLVFEFHADGGDYIVRMHGDPGQLNRYLKEQWSMSAARQAGVPTPEVLEVDHHATGVPYMVSRKLEGTDATHHPERLPLLHELGRLAAKVHTVRTHGYGRVFDWSSNQLSRCARWADFLDQGWEVERCLAPLRKSRLLTPAQLEALDETLHAMRGWRRPPVLNHGDLRLKNLVVAPESAKVVALIDWDEAMSAPPPYWDLAIALHDLNCDEKEAFLDGYGITPQAYAKTLRFLQAINTVNYGRAVEQMLQRKEEGRLGWYRARLQGQFDLSV
jgi:aminoglycoside phosphotransferase (APT) family kinase protein